MLSDIKFQYFALNNQNTQINKHDSHSNTSETHATLSGQIPMSYIA